MQYAVIMAGGAGLRLWPLSRRNHPKQLLRLFGDASLLRKSYDRVAQIFPAEQIHVITGRDFVASVAQELPELPKGNIFGEPMGRDTTNAVGLAASILYHRDPNAVVGMFTADHVISPPDRFRAAVERAFAVVEANPDALATFGVRPTRPDTNYGYIARGERLEDKVYWVQRFTEKPDLASALKYLSSGEYYWNSGMFVWTARTILDQVKKQLPQSHGVLSSMGADWDRDQDSDRFQELYKSLMRISIDFAVLERATSVIVVELDCHWVDVGSWTAIESVMQADADGNVNACSHAVHLGSRGNICVSEAQHLIATVGVDDLVIVHSPDATLICTRRDASAIKELLENIRSRYGEEYS